MYKFRRGTIVINANPDYYDNCFQNTVESITLQGALSEQTKIDLAGTANNGNVTY